MTKALIAKVSRPRLFDVVPRERLFALLDANRGRPLVWIVSPPGAGKTTLVASWLDARNIPSLWYQVDPGDADPAALFGHLSQAADALCATTDSSLPRFAAEHLADVPAFARIYFRALFARLPPGVAVVLDNYQDAPDDAILHDVIRECVLQTPPGNAVIGVSRSDAPPSFIRFAANGAMITFGWDRLQLSRDEVIAICAKRGVTDGWLVQALHQQAQGWAAGITLMLERVGHVDGGAHELPSDTRESVFNYFANLIFDQASQATRDILLSVAFLPQVTPVLATQLSGHAEAPQLLDDLYRRRLFTDRRSGPEPTFQFHALFLDFLRMRARETFDASELAQCVARSARALEAHGSIEPAMDLWLAHACWEEAGRLIVEQAGRILESGRRETLRRWIEALPAPQRTTRPWLVYWLGRAFLQTEPETGTRILEQALHLFRRCDDRAGLLDCLTTLVSGAFLGFHALDAMEGWLDEFLAEIERTSGFASVNAELRVWGTLCMTLFHTRPWHPLVEPSYHRVEALLPECKDPGVALGAALGALVVSGLSGDFDRGDRIADIAIRLAERPTASPAEAAWCFGQLGWLRFQEARYEDALDHLGRGLRIAETNGLRVVPLALTLWKFTVEWRAVRWSVANATLAQAEAMLRRAPGQGMHEAQLLLFKARQATHRDLRDEAARLTLLAHEAALRLGSRLQELIFSLSGADILLETGHAEPAAGLLAHARAIVDRAPIYRCYRAVVCLLYARHAELTSDDAAVSQGLAHSLALAREGNNRFYLRFADWAMPRLFGRAIEAGIEVDLVRALIPLFRLKPPRGASNLWPWPIRIFTLGRFDVVVDNNRLEFPRKLPRKTLLLLKAIIACGGQDVPDQSLCDALWSDDDGDAAVNALAITIVRLRRLLGSSEAVTHQGGRVSLNPELCWVDAWEFEQRLASGTPMTAATLDLYSGAFLADDRGEPWSIITRERLRGRFIDALSAGGGLLESAGDDANAVQCYLRGIDADPAVETFYQGLMRCYERMGRRTEAISAYRRMRQVLSVVLSVPPSEISQRQYARLLGNQASDGLPATDTAEPVVHLASRRRGP